jgi:hypothetical protein
MGCACPVANSIDSFSREINGRSRSFRRRDAEASAAAESVAVEENREGRKFSVQRSLEVLNETRSEPHD